MTYCSDFDVSPVQRLCRCVRLMLRSVRETCVSNAEVTRDCVCLLYRPCERRPAVDRVRSMDWQLGPRRRDGSRCVALTSSRLRLLALLLRLVTKNLLDHISHLLVMLEFVFLILWICRCVKWASLPFLCQPPNSEALSEGAVRLFVRLSVPYLDSKNSAFHSYIMHDRSDRTLLLGNLMCEVEPHAVTVATWLPEMARML